MPAGKAAGAPLALFTTAGPLPCPFAPWQPAQNAVYCVLPFAGESVPPSSWKMPSSQVT